MTTNECDTRTQYDTWSQHDIAWTQHDIAWTQQDTQPSMAQHDMAWTAHSIVHSTCTMCGAAVMTTAPIVFSEPHISCAKAQRKQHDNTCRRRIVGLAPVNYQWMQAQPTAAPPASYLHPATQLHGRG